jgi:hypothetical protein
MRKADSPLIFDTDLSGNGIINYFPEKTRTIDLSRVGDQVALFDTMLDMAKGGKGPDFVVDLSAHEINRFFRVFSDIGFERGAFEAHLDIQICYIISWTMNSLQRADTIRKSLSISRFTAVRNMAVEALAFTPTPEQEAKVPNIEIDLFLNALSRDVLRIVNENWFSFATFIEGGYSDIEYEKKIEIWNFLEDVYNQLRAS